MIFTIFCFKIMNLQGIHEIDAWKKSWICEDHELWNHEMRGPPVVVFTYSWIYIFLSNFLRGKSDAISHLADVDKVTGHDDGHFYSRHFCHHSHLGTFLRPYLTLLARDRRLMAHISVTQCDEIIFILKSTKY